LQGCRVRVLDDFSTGTAENLAHLEGRKDLSVLKGDIRDRALVERAMEGADIVFHLACRGVRHSIGNPWENHEVNASGTLVLLAAARAAGVGRFVHVSSSEVYGTARRVPMDEEHPCFPETVYGAAKLAGEAYARAYHQTYGLPTVVVRPFNNYGPRSHHEGDSGEVIPRFVVWALNGRPPVIFGDGHQTRDFIYVADTAYWLCRVAESNDLIGRTVNLGTGSETSVLELAEVVYREAGAGPIPPEYQPDRPGDVRRHLAGVELARATLGFEIQTHLAEGIRRLIRGLRESGQDLTRLLKTTPKTNWAIPPGRQAD
jgi:UDP-glucose 4-epimerase